MTADHLIHELRKRGTQEVIETIASSLSLEQERLFLRKFTAMQTAALERTKGKLKRGHIVEIILKSHECAVDSVDVSQPEGNCHKCGGPVTPEQLLLGTETELHGTCQKCQSKESL